MVDESTLVAIVATHGPISTEDAAQLAGCTRRAADYRLRKLYADGELESTAVGTSHRWWIPDHTDHYPTLHPRGQA